MREVYNKIYRNNRFGYVEKEKEYCDRVINVTFEYAVKEFNRTGNDIYLKIGETLDKLEFKDCLAVRGNEIVAVKVGCETVQCKKDIELPKYFHYEDGCYHAKQNVRTIKSVADIRTELYKRGFVCNGIRYIRWKRSSGSARVGKCLFIDEKLYNMFHRWEMCNLDIKKGNKVDLAALESYISLTSSSIVGSIHLEAKNILVIEDYDSVFEDDVVNVSDENGVLISKFQKAKISNSIFDGESLIEKEAMGDFKDKGMILLRNRFFKSCCFSSNIQKWFEDNNITDIAQLNGVTLATDIKDIKLITTPNSIKYMKFSSLDKWLKILESNFGVVKSEKPTHFLDGKLVQTHYQLINSIQLSKTEMQELLAPTFSFMSLIKNSPEALRYWIKFKIEEEIDISPLKSKTDVAYKMMSVNNDFYKTKLYYDFKIDFLKSFTKDLKCGHVLVNGNYSTICGNPIEMLMQSIGNFNGKPVMDSGCVYCKRFDWGKTLLGSRSPHITMSNVLIVENKYNNLIGTYMNPTKEIVYINSINENILQQLAGCDFDSDSILLTDNEILISSTLRNYNKFKVAVCSVGGNKKQRRYTNEDLADLDIKTSKNLIGDIINLSQELNTMIWDNLAKGASIDEVQSIYLDVCKLSIMSGIEIDKAKKEFIIDNGKELSKIRLKYRNVTKDGKSIKPNFFSHISKQKGYYNPQKKIYIKHSTSMDFLQQCVNSYRMSRKNQNKHPSHLPFSNVVDKNGFDYEKVYDKQIAKILNEVDCLNKQISAIYSDDTLKSQEKYLNSSSIRQNFIEYLGRLKFNKNTMIALLQTIEKEENKKYSRLLFYTLFGYPNTSFYDIIQKSHEDIKSLEEDLNGDIIIYNYNFSIK